MSPELHERLREAALHCPWLAAALAGERREARPGDAIGNAALSLSAEVARLQVIVASYIERYGAPAFSGRPL